VRVCVCLLTDSSMTRSDPSYRRCSPRCVCVPTCVRACVCLSAIISSELLVQSSPTFLCMLPMAVARSSSGGEVICYVFPVLWMTSYLHISSLTARRQASMIAETPPTSTFSQAAANSDVVSYHTDVSCGLWTLRSLSNTH